METKDLCDRNVKVMYSFYFLFSMARGLMQGPFLDQFIFTLASETSENLGNLIVGSFESVAGITKLLVAIPIGCWLDARPTHRAAVARRAVPWGLLAVTFGVTSLWTDRLELVGLMLFIFTCFSELATCVAGAIFADSLMSKSLSERTSAYTKCQVFETLGYGVGSGLNGVAMLIFKSQDLDEWSGFQTKATLLAGFALLLPTMLALVAFKNPPHVVKDTSDESSEGSEEARCWVPYLLSMSLLLSSLGSGLIVKFLPLFFIQLHGMSPAEISLLQCANPFMMAAATKLLGSCAQAVGRGKISVFCLVGVILSLIFMSKVSTLWLLLALFIIRGSLANARFPLTWSILMDYTPSTRRGLWNSVLSVLSMSWSASAVLGGAIVDQHSYQYSFQVAAGLFAAALALFLPLLTLPLDASTSESGSEPETSTTEPETEMSAGCCVVVVDPFSTGGVLAAELLQRGVQVIALWTKESNVRHHDYPSALEPQQLLAEIDEAATLQETAAAVQQVAAPLAIICGGDSGVKMTDALSDLMGLRSNGGAVNRRDKQVQQETLKAAGLRSARSARGTSWDEV
ncbi:Argininosuccinate lyase 2, partial [Durusdinium trenchii]